MERDPIFRPYKFDDCHRAEMDRDGHFIFPGLLTQQASKMLTKSLENILSLSPLAVKGHEPNRFSAEYDEYLESLISHPQMLNLARQVLGEEIRYDHCVALNRPEGNKGVDWHSHAYSEDDRNLKFVRIFFYVNGFQINNGGLKVVAGSHHFRDPDIKARTDQELERGWMAGKVHPITGKPLKVEFLTVPACSVILMWTHAAHAVSSKCSQSETRWTVVYAFRNPGKPSRARWISPQFEKKLIPGSEGLMSLY